LTGLIPALAGADVIYGPGMLESGITFDFGQLVMDCEFVRMIRYVLSGIAVNTESLAQPVIQDIGSQGDFLGHPHTFRHMTDQSTSELIDRRNRGKWQREGSRDMLARASQKARRLLDTHIPAPLPKHVTDAVRKIVIETEREMGIGSAISDA
jgi:trimethylamine--corrinoid protein Co-methyltransferase